MWHGCFDRENGAAVRGAGRSAETVGARAQLLRGAHDALGYRPLALHYGRLRVQGLHPERYPAQTGRRAQPPGPQRPAIADEDINSCGTHRNCRRSYLTADSIAFAAVTSFRFR